MIGCIAHAVVKPIIFPAAFGVTDTVAVSARSPASLGIADAAHGLFTAADLVAVVCRAIDTAIVVMGICTCIKNVLICSVATLCTLCNAVPRLDAFTALIDISVRGIAHACIFQHDPMLAIAKCTTSRLAIIPGIVVADAPGILPDLVFLAWCPVILAFPVVVRCIARPTYAVVPLDDLMVARTQLTFSDIPIVPGIMVAGAPGILLDLVFPARFPVILTFPVVVRDISRPAYAFISLDDLVVARTRLAFPVVVRDIFLPTYAVVPLDDLVVARTQLAVPGIPIIPAIMGTDTPGLPADLVITA
jgi:hypothetical protein